MASGVVIRAGLIACHSIEEGGWRRHGTDMVPDGDRTLPARMRRTARMAAFRHRRAAASPDGPRKAASGTSGEESVSDHTPEGGHGAHHGPFEGCTMRCEAAARV
ncbi:hypothetical protein GCM10023317_69370 [Actinopolymorpha pittospori]